MELSFPVEQPVGGLTELVRLDGGGSGSRRARRRGQHTGGDDIVSGVDGKSDNDNMHSVSWATIRNFKILPSLLIIYIKFVGHYLKCIPGFARSLMLVAPCPLDEPLRAILAGVPIKCESCEDKLE